MSDRKQKIDNNPKEKKSADKHQFNGEDLLITSPSHSVEGSLNQPPHNNNSAEQAIQETKAKFKDTLRQDTPSQKSDSSTIVQALQTSVSELSEIKSFEQDLMQEIFAFDKAEIETNFESSIKFPNSFSKSFFKKMMDEVAAYISDYNVLKTYYEPIPEYALKMGGEKTTIVYRRYMILRNWFMQESKQRINSMPNNSSVFFYTPQHGENFYQCAVKLTNLLIDLKEENRGNSNMEALIEKYFYKTFYQCHPRNRKMGRAFEDLVFIPSSMYERGADTKLLSDYFARKTQYPETLRRKAETSLYFRIKRKKPTNNVSLFDHHVQHPFLDIFSFIENMSLLARESKVDPRYATKYNDYKSTLIQLINGVAHRRLDLYSLIILSQTLLVHFDDHECEKYNQSLVELSNRMHEESRNELKTRIENMIKRGEKPENTIRTDEDLISYSFIKEPRIGFLVLAKVPNSAYYDRTNMNEIDLNQIWSGYFQSIPDEFIVEPKHTIVFLQPVVTLQKVYEMMSY